VAGDRAFLGGCSGMLLMGRWEISPRRHRLGGRSWAASLEAGRPSAVSAWS